MMFLKKTHWGVVLTLSITLIFINEGCTGNQTGRAGVTGLQTPAITTHNVSMLVADKPTFSNVQINRESTGLVWVPLEETAKSMDLELHYTNDSFTMGNTDAAYSVKVNQTQALVGDKPVVLPQAPRFFDHKPYMTTQALSTLLGTPVNWNGQNSQVVITPIDDRSVSQKQSTSATSKLESTGQGDILSLSISNKSDIIKYAESFLGTPYQFGAGPYDNTRTFDCSSFTQYVYAHFGVNLPRSSRSQAQVGQNVAIDQLQPGDLMFFYTPGRFASNRIVGHEGMYAGNGKIIHTYGQPGVTISNFNAYWRNRFLFAKRVA